MLRGTEHNPANRFARERYATEHVEGIDDWEHAPRPTQYIFQEAKTLVNEVTSPDVGMLWSANPYQGCEHGCIYCYARPTHEYWGLSAGQDFETNIIAKKNAADLLRQKFESKSWQPSVLSLSGNTDCYQPLERKLKLTRSLLEVCLEYCNPVGIITKNALVLRDLDLLEELAALNLVRVFSSVTGVDDGMRLKLEPRTSTYKTRLAMLEKLAAAGVPVGIMNAPIIPGINDDQIPQVLQAAASSGVRWAGYTIVRLVGPVGLLFREWLQTHYPDRAEKVWNLITALHGGDVKDSRFGTRMRGEGPWSQIIAQQFRLHCRRLGLNVDAMEWNLDAFRRGGPQLSLF